ncbi:MAG: hypothetical protein CMF60_02930 [Magnetococcales bacterium]|nr:hypothetical protein [Magnetococcales bacterium]|tara:strand:- start:24543 stop:24791 length:249 start_codon:yes stop_codon:yes gene_type:complete
MKKSKAFAAIFILFAIVSAFNPVLAGLCFATLAIWGVAYVNSSLAHGTMPLKSFRDKVLVVLIYLTSPLWFYIVLRCYDLLV